MTYQIYLLILHTLNTGLLHYQKHQFSIYNRFISKYECYLNIDFFLIICTIKSIYPFSTLPTVTSYPLDSNSLYNIFPR